MVDPDLPAPLTGENLHWMQTGLVSAQTATTLAGTEVFVLTSGTGNTTSIAPYNPPSPPARAPTTHRYVFLLVETTNNQAALSVLTTAAGSPRIPFSASETLSQAGLQVLAGNWFNVTNSSTASTPSGTSGSGMPSGTGAQPSSTSPFAGAAMVHGPSVALLGLGTMMGYL
jgi:phosphatidylethanolamine-binding protein